VYPVPDPLLLRKSGSSRNRTRTSGSIARTLTTRPQRRPTVGLQLILMSNHLEQLYVLKCYSFSDTSWVPLNSTRVQKEYLIPNFKVEGEPVPSGPLDRAGT
jgi:hypothetical protein